MKTRTHYLLAALLLLLVATLDLFAADTAGAVSGPSAVVSSAEGLTWVEALIAGLALLLTGGTRWLLPRLPKVVCVFLPLVLGVLIDQVLPLLHLDAGPAWQAALAGAFSTWLYEAQKQVRRASTVNLPDVNYSFLLFMFLVPFVVLTGCARFSTTQTEIRNEQDTKITTKASGYSFFAGQAALAKWSAKQSASTQQAEVGDLNVRSDATTNAAAIVEAVVRAAISAAK